MKYFLKRLYEPSTYAGVAGVVAHGQGIASGAMTLEYGIAGIILSLLAVFAPEGLNQQLKK